MSSPDSTMRAITYHRYGGPEVLAVEEVARPRVGPDQILVRVQAAEACKSDCEMRGFGFSVKWFWLPLRLALGVRRPRRSILGLYFAGVVEEVGPDVEVVVRWAQRAQGVARADSPPADDPERAAREPVLQWLSAASIDGLVFELLDLTVDGDRVEVVVGGPEPPPPSATLADDVAALVGGEVSLTVRWIQQLAIAGSGESDERRVTRLLDAWAGARTSVRVLEVSVRGGVAVIDLATDGTPSGLEVLDRLVRAELGEAAGVDIRAVPLATLTPALRTQEPPVVD